ncbi:MAG: hypothetical protein AAFR88_01385 [Pseudomonadota bacterium]
MALCVACAPESGVPTGERVECALDGAPTFEASCILEKLDTSGTSFAVHSPEGGFRRFSYDASGGVLTIQDGAEGIAINPDSSAGYAEFTVGPDRYRIAISQLAPSE